ncbi:MAG: hypothetical protein KAU14_01680 [Thermoplasmata archaeon]|nr:hypothetical protein [Thermoplasmata archaeon]
MEMKELTMEKEELKWIVPRAYDFFVGKVKMKEPRNGKGKYEIEARSKIKSLVEALRQFDDPEESVLHFVKYAEYFLPRSQMNATLNELLKAVSEIQKREKDYERVQRQIRYLVGYAAWSMDALVNVFNDSHGENEVRERVRRMLDTEFSIVGAPEKVEEYTEQIMKWYQSAGKQRHGDYHGRR